MRPDDVYALTHADDPRLSPDGRLIAYVVTRIDREESAYRSAIWVVPVDGSEEPRQFTSGERRDGSPRWSPDGKWLAFTSNRDGDEEEKAKGQLYVAPADGGGEPRKLTDGDESVEAFAWSPDSSRIAFARRVRDAAYAEESDRKRAPRRFTRVFYKLDSVGWTGDRRKHLFVVGLDGGERQLTDGDCENDAPAWSPDGKRIAFSAMRGERWDVDLREALYVLDVYPSDAEPRRLTAEDETANLPSFSPDGSLIAYLHAPDDGTSPHHGQIAVVAADGGDRRVLTAGLDRHCETHPLIREPVWDADRVVFAVEDGGNVHLYAAAADGSAEPEILAGGERSIGLYDVVDSVLVYTASTHTRPHELFVEDKRVTNVADAFAASCELVEPERFTAVSADGTEVDAWLVRPAGFEEGRTYPTLLTIHGGPFGQYGTGFFDEVQVYSGGGYAVLFSNPRGGSGYSEVGTRDPRPDRRRWQRLGRRRLRGSDGRRRHGAREVPVPRRRPARRARRLVRRLHDELDHRPHEPVQGGALGAGRQQPHGHVRLERHRLGLQEAVRRAHVGGHGRVSRDVAGHVRAGDRDARPRPPLRERPPLQHRAGRAALQHAACDGQGRRDAALPRREPRALALGLAGAPRHAVRGDPRVVRALPRLDPAKARVTE
jgi:dipeptidyl aminopeptidase/acylaminoacyl peptidase